MNRLYLVTEHVDYEGSTISGVFDNYGAAKQLRDELTSKRNPSYGPTYHVEPHSICSSVQQHKKHLKKRRNVRELLWLRKMNKRSPDNIPEHVLEKLQEYRDKNLL